MKAEIDHSVCKQVRWQRKQMANGRCATCGEPADGMYCPKHRRIIRKKQRDRQRIKAGIPLDAPLSKRGRPRLKTI